MAWVDQLAAAGLPEHVAQHISTMARLHREDRYNRATDDVEQILGRPALSVEQYVSPTVSSTPSGSVRRFQPPGTARGRARR